MKGSDGFAIVQSLEKNCRPICQSVSGPAIEPLMKMGGRQKNALPQRFQPISLAHLPVLLSVL